MNLQDLLEGKTTASELSDSKCREYLRYLVHTHRRALIQLENAYQQDKANRLWITPTKPSPASENLELSKETKTEKK